MIMISSFEQPFSLFIEQSNFFSEILQFVAKHFLTALPGDPITRCLSVPDMQPF